MGAVGHESDSTEERLLEKLEQILTDTSSFGNSWRIQLLEELESMLKSGRVANKEKAFELLIDIAKLFADGEITSSLVQSCLFSLIEADATFFSRTLEELSKQKVTIIILSNLVMELDYKKKKEAIKALVDSLMNFGVEEQRGTEICGRLVHLGNENLAGEIVKTSSPYLDASISKPSAIIYSLQLCSKFADRTLTPKMLDLIEKAEKGLFGNQKTRILTEICNFIEKTHDPTFLSRLVKLSEDPISRNVGVSKSLAGILNASPDSVEFIIEFLYETKNRHAVEIIIPALEQSEVKVDVKKLLQALQKGGKRKYPLGWQIENVIVRSGKRANPSLIELMKNDEDYEFGLDALKKIGISEEELYAIFPKSPMLQLYNFFYGKLGRNPCKFDIMLKKPKELGQEISGKKQTNLDFLVMNLFSCFNLVTMQIDSSGKKGADVLCFNDETLDVLIIGCTTGTIKDDLKTLDALLGEMENEIPDIFSKCKVTPLIFSTGTPSFVASDVKDANQMNAILLGIEELNKIVEMLNTGRSSKDLLNFLNEVFTSQKVSGSSQLAFY
jgi:hypothetical protein